MFLLAAFVAYALGVSFFCSLLEASVFSVRGPRLKQQADAGNRGAALLQEIKDNRLDDAITSILILNTLANTLGAALAGWQAGKIFEKAGVGIFTGLMVLAILIGSEIIPKTLGAIYADRLAPFVGRTINLLIQVMGPMLLLTRALTRLLMRGKSSGTSRGDVAAVVDLATREGALSGEESALMGNLLALREVRLEDLMTPRTVCTMMSATATLQELLDDPDAAVYSRIPLYGEDQDDILGYVLKRDLLKPISQGQDLSQPLSTYLRDIDFLPQTSTAAQALKRFQGRREHIAIVTDEHGGTAGLISLEDLTETLLGIEILDESDKVADLRQLATRLRDERLARRG